MEQELNIIKEITAYLDERKAEDIVVLDLRQHANIADYFIIVTGANKPHLKALNDGLQRCYKNHGFKGFQRAGFPESGWMIFDYQGIMVHIFERELREFYDLERLWKDVPRIEVEVE